MSSLGPPGKSGTRAPVRTLVLASALLTGGLGSAAAEPALHGPDPAGAPAAAKLQALRDLLARSEEHNV